jgi:hypothetical protein
MAFDAIIYPEAAQNLVCIFRPMDACACIPAHEGPVTAKVCGMAIWPGWFGSVPPSAPQPLKPAACRAGVVDGVPGIAMTEVILDEAQVMTFVGQDEPAGMPQGVRMNA